MIDIFFAIILITAIVKGYRKGLIVALFSIIAFVIGLAAALKLSAVVANRMEGTVNVGAKWMPFVSFGIVFFVVVLLVNWGGKLVEKTFKMAMLGWVNRLGGIALYAILYTIIFSIFLFYSEKIHLLTNDAVANSKSYPLVQPWAPVIMNTFGSVIPIFQNMFTQLETFFGKLSNKI
jgi:membrane protein required for colicin V production